MSGDDSPANPEHKQDSTTANRPSIGFCFIIVTVVAVIVSVVAGVLDGFAVLL